MPDRSNSSRSGPAGRGGAGRGGLRVLALTCVAFLMMGGTVARAGDGDGAGAAAPERPNILYVLTDDLSADLVRYMPAVKRLQRRGSAFSRYFVTASLCCPSRASILTGRYPHNTKILTNTPPDGGFVRFTDLGEDRDTFATSLQAAGYHTALVGKYLNGYVPDEPRDGQTSYVPPGWDDWYVGGHAYKSYDYDLSENGRVVHYGSEPDDYLTDVLERKARGVIRRSARAEEPFALVVSTFAPHAPNVPAPRDKDAFEKVKAPRGGAFNEPPTSTDPAWRPRGRLTEAQVDDLDRAYRKRVQSVQAVDDLLDSLVRDLRRRDLLDTTYVVFNSDNGFHLGEHALMDGKNTAFDSDIRVPLIVAGPDVRAHHVVPGLASNIDVRPTLEAFGGVVPSTAIDGTSLVPMLQRGGGTGHNRAVLIEHHGPVKSRRDPDRPRRGAGNPPAYAAIRLRGELFVEYWNGFQEYYDLRTDRFALENRAAEAPRERIGALHEILKAMRSCRGVVSCQAAQGP